MPYFSSSSRIGRNVGLRRTPFVRKPGSKGPSRDTPLERSRKRIRAVGKKGLKSARALRVFKKAVARLGLDERCERRGPNCTGTEQLTWAHGRKRSELKAGELESFAIICCVNCHREMDEGMSHEGMAAEVSRIIALRPERHLEAA